MIAKIARPRLAPTEKLSPSLAITSAFHGPLPSPIRPIALPIMAMMSGSSELPLEWNSRQTTPSPISHSEAEAVLRERLAAALDVFEQQHALGRARQS